MNTGGVYVVEDTQTSYWPLFGGSSADPDSTQTTMGFFKSLVHGLNHAELTRQNYQPNYFDKNVSAITFYHNMILIYKGNNSQDSKFPQDHEYRVIGGS
jgi:demethylmacrocin O-methyltransferase